MRRYITVILAAVLIQGCLLDRLETSRKHLCSQQIVLSLDDSIAIYFYKPVLYPEDIVKILGARPSGEKFMDTALIYAFRVIKRGDPSGRFDIPGSYKLMGITRTRVFLFHNQYHFNHSYTVDMYSRCGESKNRKATGGKVISLQHPSVCWLLHDFTDEYMGKIRNRTHSLAAEHESRFNVLHLDGHVDAHLWPYNIASYSTGTYLDTERNREGG